MKTEIQGMIQALDSLTLASENLQTSGDTQIILLSTETFSFMSHLFYWEEILGQINLFQKKLQKHGIGFDVCTTHMDAITIFFNRNMDRLVSESVNQSKTKCKESEIFVNKRI